MGSVPGKSAGGSDAAGTETNSAASPVSVSAPAADAAQQVAGRDALQASAVASAAAPDTAAASQPQQAVQRLVTPDAAAQLPVESVAATESAALSAAPASPAQAVAVDDTGGAAGSTRPTSQDGAFGSSLVSLPEVRRWQGLGRGTKAHQVSKCCACVLGTLSSSGHVRRDAGSGGARSADGFAAAGSSPAWQESTLEIKAADGWRSRQAAVRPPQRAG
jgi:hypothetical protein